MNVIKTGGVSTISLIIAMSAAALSAGPSLAEQLGMEDPARQQAMETPQLFPSGKQACATNFLPLNAGVRTSTGITTTFTIGVPRFITVLFSSEIRVAAAANTVNLSYSIDGVVQPTGTMGPVFFANGPLTNFSTRTAFGRRTALLAAGTHTITPFLTAGAGGGSAFFRCFSVGRTETE